MPCSGLSCSESVLRLPKLTSARSYACSLRAETSFSIARTFAEGGKCSPAPLPAPDPWSALDRPAARPSTATVTAMAIATILDMVPPFVEMEPPGPLPGGVDAAILHLWTHPRKAGRRERG